MTTPAPSPSAPSLPVSLAANPVLSSWVRFSPDGEVMISPGKVEIGQGIVTALAQIAADELDVDIGRVQMVRPSTAASPNEASPQAVFPCSNPDAPSATPAPKSGKSFLTPPQIAWASGSMR